MNDYIFFMHDDAPTNSEAQSDEAWERYFVRLRAGGHFSGGSEIGSGVCVSKSGSGKPISAHLSGYIRLRAESLDDVRQWLIGNPVFESGGTVEIRELPAS